MIQEAREVVFVRPAFNEPSLKHLAANRIADPILKPKFILEHLVDTRSPGGCSHELLMGSHLVGFGGDWQKEQ